MAFLKRPDLISTLYHAKKEDVEYLKFFDQITNDIRDMERKESSVKQWVIPRGIPAELVLKQAKKRHHRLLKFTLKPMESASDCGTNYLLCVYDPRPAENYKYGYDARLYR
jgi:hypothetical protein